MAVVVLLVSDACGICLSVYIYPCCRFFFRWLLLIVLSSSSSFLSAPLCTSVIIHETVSPPHTGTASIFHLDVQCIVCVNTSIFHWQGSTTQWKGLDFSTGKGQPQSGKGLDFSTANVHRKLYSRHMSACFQAVIQMIGSQHPAAPTFLQNTFALCLCHVLF